MATGEHTHPNYMAIFWYLAILTVLEIAVIFAGLPKFTLGVILCAMALTKAALVAMYWHFVVALWPVLFVTVYLL